MKTRKLMILGVLVACVAVGVLFLPVREWFMHLEGYVKGLGRIGPIAVALVYVLSTILFIPGSALTIGSGTLFGLKTGFLVVLVGANLGALCAFLLARTFLREKVARWADGNPKFRSLDRAIGRQGFKMVFLSRLSPAFPFTLLNYLVGLTAIRTGAYVLANLLGMLPGIFLYVYIGAAARDALAGHANMSAGFYQQLLKYVGLLATVAVVVIVTRIARKAIREAEETQNGDTATERPRLDPDDKPTSFEKMMIADDAYDRWLIENCHPPNWVNPTPGGKYNLVVLGAGTAGLVSAAGAAGLGAKVALIERNLMGGDCLNVGCVPSKGVIRAARAAYDARNGKEFGIQLACELNIASFSAAMERMRRLRAGISSHDSAERFRKLGVDVYIGHGRFVGLSAVEVDGKRLEFDRAVIATGARAAELPIPGLAEARYYTNETIFTLTELPRRIAVIGAGPLGCELAQAFGRFGSEVYLIEALHGIMPNEDPDAAEIVRQSMIDRDGVKLMCCGKELRVSNGGSGTKRLTVDSHANHYDFVVDEILVAAGRKPNLEGLGLEEAGAQYTAQGVVVDGRLRTTNPKIYAAGDVCSRYKFTHAADAMARIVIANALFFARRKVTDLVIPWCTYTDPEVAHVGYYEKEARAAGFDVATITESLDHVDRAILDSENDGFARVHYDNKTGRILGGTVVARHAGEMISELTLAMVAKQKMDVLSSTIHAYPTQAEVLRKVGDAYMRTKLTPTVKKLFEKWLAWRR
ncbi:MAG: FAD-containing oxidoreductase [Deltaproteobacteria bacterium]|nr:FAD-containing oxidoreductase [Deltaproteobacteria bacterium]